MTELMILAAIFAATLIVVFGIILYVQQRRDISRNIGATTSRRQAFDGDIDKILGTGNEQIRYYLDVVQNDSPNSLRMRLVRAGFFSKRALVNFNVIRGVTAAIVFLLAQAALSVSMPQFSTAVLSIFSMTVACVIFILASAFLEHLGKRRSREFRKLFPDFMDLLLVCADAGLSINASIDRVTREFLLTTPDFGIQLSIINLEIRAGRPLHEALKNFSKRIGVEEANTLAVLFRQSEELGSSVSKTLRVFAREMRQMRLIRAEEKANALPVKMLFPMALFMFPVNLVIVLVPILMIILRMMLSLGPS
ncbi:MAG: type II secretion system F family protein [Rhodobacteraceae bacterium]|nr:type II secretion system F family protein [Paracoccaceae bacterium]